MSTVAPVTDAAKETQGVTQYHWAIIPRGSFTGLVMTSVNSKNSPFPYEFADYIVGPCASYAEAGRHLKSKLEQRARAAQAAFDQWNGWLDQYQEAGGK